MAVSKGLLIRLGYSTCLTPSEFPGRIRLLSPNCLDCQHSTVTKDKMMTAKELDAAIEDILGHIRNHASSGTNSRSISRLRKLLHAKLEPLLVEPATFAQVAWTAEDITDVYDVTDEKAHDLLGDFARDIQERMVERGWDAIDSLAEARGFQRRD